MSEETQNNLPKIEVVTEDAGTLKKKVTVTVPRERITTKLDEMYGELRESAAIPGFRVGRAPRRLIEKRFGKDIEGDVRNALIGEALGEAIEDADLKTLGEPDINLDDIVLPEEGDMEFAFEVEIQPEFDLPETKGIEVERKVVEIDDEKTEQYLTNIREGRARYEKTEDAANEGDQVVAAAKITGEEVDFSQPRVVLRAAAGVVEGLPIVDLGDHLKNKKAGDVVTFTTTAADTHPTEAWRGKELTIELTVQEVSHRIVPELDEEFAKSVGFDGVKELKEYVTKMLEQQVEQETQASLRQQICEKLLEAADFELPEGIIKRHTHSTLQRQMIDLMQRGMPREKIEENLAELQAAAEERAKSDLKLSFILGKASDELNIEVDDSEINSRIAMMAAQYQRRPERLRQELAADGTLEQVAMSIQEEKTLNKILEDAKVVDVAADTKEEKTA